MNTVEAIVHLVLIIAMLVLLVGGLLSILMLWYLKGRDPHTGLVADILPTPPDDLSPGAVGTLLDEHADHHDVVATLLGLGRNGAVSITEAHEKGARASDYIVTLLHPDRITARVERDMLPVLFGPDPQPMNEVRLSTVRPRFVDAEPRIRDALYAELVERNLFDRSPAATRRRWRRISWAGLIVSIAVGILLTVLTDVFALLPMVAAIIVWGVMIRVSRHLPRKTDTGAEAAAKWRAFKRYLESIEKHENLAEATALFDRYLAYAVAFRIDRGWVKAFADAGARSPRWYRGAAEVGDIGDVFDSAALGVDVARAAQMIGHFGGLSGNMPDISAPGMPNMPDMPDVDLQGASDALGGSLQAVSDGFSGLLNVAGSIFDAIDFDIDA
jgi:hypothetical protein